MTILLEALAKRGPSRRPGPRVRVHDKLAVYDDPAARLVPDAVDEGAMTATFVISTTAPDRMGDVMVSRGCLPTLDNYRRNPRIFFNHQMDPVPIGSARFPDGKLAVVVEENRVLSTCHFHGKTQLSTELFALVAARELEMASIGFLPLAAERMKGTGKGDWPDGGFLISKWDLLEWSVVGVPANQEAGRLRYDKGLNGKPLCDEIRRAIAPHIAPTRAWTNGLAKEKTMAETKADDAAPATKEEGKAGTDLQCIFCPKEGFPTADDAKAWCELHEYAADAMEEIETGYLFTQFPDAECAADSKRSEDLEDGCKAQYCQRQVEDDTQPVGEETKGEEAKGEEAKGVETTVKVSTAVFAGAAFAVPAGAKYTPSFLAALKSLMDQYRGVGEHAPALALCDLIEGQCHDLAAKHFPDLGVAFKAAPPAEPVVVVEPILTTSREYVDQREAKAAADLQTANASKLYAEITQLRQDFRKARGKVD